MASTVRDNFIDATKVEQMLAQLSAIADELTEIPGMLTKSSFYQPQAESNFAVGSSGDFCFLAMVLWFSSMFEV